MLGTNSVISGQGNKEGGENKPTKPQTFSFGRVCFNICFCFTETTGICKMFTREARIRWKRDESHPRLDNMLVLSRTGEGQIGRLYLIWYHIISTQQLKRAILAYAFLLVFTCCGWLVSKLPVNEVAVGPQHCHEGGGYPPTLSSVLHWEHTGTVFGVGHRALGAFTRPDIQLS